MPPPSLSISKVQKKHSQQLFKITITIFVKHVSKILECKLPHLEVHELELIAIADAGAGVCTRMTTFIQNEVCVFAFVQLQNF